MDMPTGASLFSEDLQEDKGNKNNSLNFSASGFYAKNFLEMDYVKDAKTDDTFEDKEKKGEPSQSGIYTDIFENTHYLIKRAFSKYCVGLHLNRLNSLL